MECLDANVVQDLMSGALDNQVRTQVLGHLDTCEDCRELLNITASDTMNESLPKFHDHDDIGLETTQAPEGDVALLATQAAGATAPGLDETRPANPHSLAGIRPPAANEEGKRLAHYTLVERLGAGAMGVVWKADDPKLGRQVAVKVLKRADEALTERLVREARSMAQVNDPHVVTVYEVGTSKDGTAFIAMELVSGKSLRAWQKTKRGIPEIIEAYSTAGKGLAAAHAAGIVHRDFKPDNVLVGDDKRVRVTDFGLAAAKPTPGAAVPQIGDVNLTTSGSVLGTPAYMAPEQFTGGNVDPRTDQFNFCVALYEALYGERPFEGKTFAELGDNVCHGRIKPAPSGSNVSSAVRAILLKGLSAKPGDRFPTMNALLQELGRDRAKPWRRTSIIAAALAVALGIGLVSDYFVRARVSGEIRQSFALTKSQVDKTMSRLTETFSRSSEIAYQVSALRELAGHHDQADFGLGSVDDDRAELERLHGTFEAADWGMLHGSQLIIGDYKGRLIYTSAAPKEWGGDLKVFESVKRALDAGKYDSMTLLPYADPRVTATGILGKSAPTQGMGLLMEKTLALGETEGTEARALYLQLQDGKSLLEEIQLDNETGLALVALDGTTSISNAQMPHELVEQSADSDEVRVGGKSYQVQTFPILGLDKQPIGRVVMARPNDAVLSLFPGARLVFALTMFGALLLAGFTWYRAREITFGRV
ncbi:MAG TPA: protein kinase [Kofleriaceae bacterium]|nr:protein kinase [Kofleriaceae bacterium]